MEKGVKFSTREWCFIIFIVIIIQFLVQWMSYQFSGSSNALGYISFAGTLVSIILGLVAIIYSFVQSISQTSTVVEIREQVEKLISAGVDIAKSKDELHASAMELSEVADNLATKVSENTSATKEVVGSVSKLSDAFISGNSSLSSEVPIHNSGKNDKKVNSVIEASRVLVVFMVVAISEGCKRGFSAQEILDKILKPISEKNLGDHEYLKGALSAVLFSLEAEGFVELPKEEAFDAKLVEKGDFMERVQEVVPGTMDGKEKLFTSLWVVINSLE